MATSEARVRANIENSKRSTGPKHEQSKMNSRKNSYKHGMTGEGIVLPDEDRAEVDRRIAALEEQYQPVDEVQAQLVRQIAICGLRMDRGARQETAHIAERMRTAVDDHDDAKLADAEHLLDWIAAEPATNARRLRRTPEGVDLLIREWSRLAEVISGREWWHWSAFHLQRIENLNGRRPEEFPASRDAIICQVLWGQATNMDPAELEALKGREINPWAREQLLERVTAEIESLKALRASFDHEAIARDRADATARAMFDTSKEGILARKYDAANERSLFRTLREFREVQADTPEVVAIDPVASESPAELGSFFQEPPAEAVEEADADPTPANEPQPPVPNRKARRKRLAEARSKGR